MEASRRQKKARQFRLKVQVLLTVFFVCNGVVHHEFTPKGRTVNKEYYHEVMLRLREAIRQKRTELLKNQSQILYHYNASAHTSMLGREFLPKNKIVIMPQPPYSPDLVSAAFFLFQKLKTLMIGQRFATTEELKENRNRSCWQYQKRHLGSVSRIGKNAGISVLYMREVTLKVTRCIHTYIIGHYNPSVSIIDLVLTPLMLCVLILDISCGTCSLKSTPNDRFF